MSEHMSRHEIAALVNSVAAQIVARVEELEVAVFAGNQPAPQPAAPGDEPTGVNPNYDELSDRTAGAIHAVMRDGYSRPVEERRAIINAVVNAIRPLFNRLRSDLAAAKARLAEIDAGVKADADDLEKMRDGTKLTRAGVVAMLVYQNQDIAELKDKLAAATAERDRLRWELGNANRDLRRESALADHQAEGCDKLGAALAAMKQRAEQAERHVKALQSDRMECETKLGEYLYGPSEPGYSSWGEHVLITLIAEAVEKIKQAESDRDAARAEVERLRAAVDSYENRSRVTMNSGHPAYFTSYADALLAALDAAEKGGASDAT